MLCIVAAATGLGVSLLLIPLVMRFVHWRRWYDPTDHRKTHDGEVSAMGGIAIVLSFALAVVTAAVLFFRHADSSQASLIFSWTTVLGGAIVHLTGVFDDLYNIRALRKLVMQIIAAAVAIVGGVVIEVVTFPVSGVSIALGPFAVPLTMLWIIGITNAVNLIDGIDGFAATVVLSACLAFGVLAVVSGDQAVSVVAFGLAGAVGGFLLFNAPPARVFMGDSGSLLLGYCLAVIAVSSRASGAAGISAVVPVVLLAIPILDTSAAVARRVRRGQPIHTPDQEHFQHTLLWYTGDAKKALVITVILSAVLATTAVLYWLVQAVWTGVLVPVVLAGLVWLFAVMAQARKVPTDGTHSRRPAGAKAK